MSPEPHVFSWKIQTVLCPSWFHEETQTHALDDECHVRKFHHSSVCFLLILLHITMRGYVFLVHLFQNPVENHFWCPIGLLYAINRGQNDLDKCAQHGSWLTFFGPVDLSLRLNSFLLSFRLLTNEQPHPMPNQNTQSKQSRDTWKKQLQHVTRCREKASFSLLAEFHLLSLPNWGRVPLTVQRQKQTNFKHFQKTTWLPRDFVNVDCELWPVKAFCWILPAFGFGHLVGKAGYRFRLMLSVAICAISSK